MNEVDVLILFEHKSRELESACLLKYEFERRGLSVQIEGVFPNREILPIKYKIKYLFTPWYYTETKYVANFLKKSPDAVIVNMHHEQYTINNSDILIPKGEARYVYHLVWGDAFKEQLLSVGCSEKSIFTVGNIRLDFLKKDLLKLSPSKYELANEFGIDIAKKWALFIADSSHLLEQYQFQEMAHSGYQDVFLAANKSREDYLVCVEDYLEKHDDVIFIYRPHPCMANKDLERAELKRLKELHPNNFFIIYKYPLNVWLINSDICYSFMSSSMIECYYAKTRYYLFRSVSLREDLDYAFFYDFKYIIKNFSGLEDSLKCNDYDFNYVASKLSYWYEISEEYTFRRLVDYVLDVKNNINIIRYKNTDWKYNRIEAYIKEAIRIISKVSIFRKVLLVIKDNRINRILGNTDDIVNQLEIKELMRRINEIKP